MDAVRTIGARRLLSHALLLFPALVLISPSAKAQTVSAVPSLDLQRYLGTWHELAHYPNKPEKACVSDAVALYTARYKPRQFALVTSCQTGSGPSDAGNVNGKVDKAGDGRLTVSHFWPFTQKRWVLALGPAYEWALVGSPNHKYLWILSRSPTLTPEVLADIKSRAAAQGFDPAKLITLPRS